MQIIKQNLKRIKNRELDIVSTGKVFYVKFLLLKNDEIRISNFIGLCTSKSNKSNAIALQNTIKKEKTKLTLYLNSPLLLNLMIIKKYRKKFRLSKLYYV